MSRNRSLDEFLSGTDRSEEAAADGSTDAAAADDPVDATLADDPVDSATADGSPDSVTADDSTDPGAATVEPLDATYDWTPGGAACDACGAVAASRWRDGDGLVCEACKEW